MATATAIHPEPAGTLGTTGFLTGATEVTKEPAKIDVALTRLDELGDVLAEAYETHRARIGAVLTPGPEEGQVGRALESEQSSSDLTTRLHHACDQIENTVERLQALSARVEL